MLPLFCSGTCCSGSCFHSPQPARGTLVLPVAMTPKLFVNSSESRNTWRASRVACRFNHWRAGSQALLCFTVCNLIMIVSTSVPPQSSNRPYQRAFMLHFTTTWSLSYGTPWVPSSKGDYLRKKNMGINVFRIELMAGLEWRMVHRAK